MQLYDLYGYPIFNMYNLKWQLAQFIELRWWKQYLRKKDKNEYLNWKKQYWQNLLEKIKAHLMLPQNAALLDAGCGPAGIFIALPKQYQIDAIDPLLMRYEQNLAHFNKNEYEHVHFEAITIEQLAKQQHYNAIFCLNAINHVANLSLCLDKLNDALKKEGTLFISIDTHNYAFFKQLFRLLPGDMLHPHQYDLEDYKNMLTARNIQIIDTICLKKAFLFDYHLIIGKKQTKTLS